MILQVSIIFSSRKLFEKKFESKYNDVYMTIPRE